MKKAYVIVIKKSNGEVGFYSSASFKNFTKEYPDCLKTTLKNARQIAKDLVKNYANENCTVHNDYNATIVYSDYGLSNEKIFGEYFRNNEKQNE